MSSHTVIVDDSATDIIEYMNIELGPFRGKGWSTQTGPSLDEETEGPIHNSTLHVATVEDTSIVFPFNGTRVAVFGSIWPPTATFASLTLSQYSVLGWDYGGSSSMQPFQAPNLTSPKNNVNFFTSNDMPYASYVLTINITTASENSPYYLDYIAVQVPGPAASSSSTPSSATSEPAITPSSSSPSSPQSSTGGITVLPSLPGFISTKPPQPVGAIVGATIGGVIVIAVMVITIICAHMRRHRWGSFEFDYGSMRLQDSPLAGTPYTGHSSLGGMVQRGDHCLTSIPEMTPYTPSASPTTFLLSRKALSASSIRPLSDATNSSTSASDNAVAPSPLGLAVAVSADGANANSHNQEQNRDTGSEESPPAYTPAPAHDGIAIAV